MPLSSIDIPVDLQKAIQHDAAAMSAFNALPPSHKREYIKWIEEAKKPDTRNRRISETIKRLTIGTHVQ